eukprot:scaffold2376_cov80-Skeletonema_marinoi.AAC.3
MNGHDRNDGMNDLQSPYDSTQDELKLNDGDHPKRELDIIPSLRKKRGNVLPIMVTKIVIHVSPKGRVLSMGRASTAEDSKRANDIKHLQKRHDDNADDKYDAVQGNEEGEIQLYRLQGCLNEVTSEGICDGQSYHDVSTQGKLNDDTTADDLTHDEIDDGAVDVGNSSKKRPLLLDDEGGTEETKRRKRTQPFIDLTDVPPQLPIKNNKKDASSKYQGVCFNKSINKWKAQIMLDGKQHHIGNYDNEEEAAVDYARALFKYGSRRQRKFIDLTESSKYQSKNGSSKYEGVYFNKANNKWNAQITIDGKQHYIGAYDNEEEAAVDYARAAHTYGVEFIQKGRSSSRTKAQQDMRSRVECKNQTQHGAVCRFESVDEKLSFPMELANKGGRIGIYLPDERKARIARFHAKRSTRVFRRRVTSDSRKKYADSRPRIKGRFVTQKSVVGGEDSD